MMIQDYDGAGVVDPAGNAIGTVERTYNDTQGVARFVEVKIGTLFAKHRLVPVDQASFADGTLTVPFTRGLVEDSPDAGPAGDVLDGNLMQSAGDYYDGLNQSAIPASMVATAHDNDE
jgi:hypothetical protein